MFGALTKRVLFIPSQVENFLLDVCHIRHYNKIPFKVKYSNDNYLSSYHFKQYQMQITCLAFSTNNL